MPKIDLESIPTGELLVSPKEKLEQVFYGTRFPHPPSEFDIILHITENIAQKCASNVNSEQVAEAILYIKKNPDSQNTTLISEFNNPARDALTLKTLETYYQDHQSDIQPFDKGKAAFHQYKDMMTHLRETYAQPDRYQEDVTPTPTKESKSSS